MGSFSIWHWIVVLLMFSPPIIGLAVMGSQRAITVKHSASGLVRDGQVGYSITYFFFGWLVPVIRGEIAIGVLHLVLTLASFGLFQWLVMPYLYNRQHMTRLLTNGWVLADTEEMNQLARARLGIAAS